MDWYTFKIAHIERLTADSVRLDLTSTIVDVDFSFKAGQYITFSHLHEGKEIRRSYSICSAPSDGRLSVGIKEVPDGIFSTFANRVLAKGDEVKVAKPQGSFINPSAGADDKDYVFFAAGSGIPPMLSLIKSILESTTKSTATLFYGNKNARSIMFLEELESIKNNYTNRFSLFHVLSRQAQDSDLFNGRIDAEKIGMWDKIFDVNSIHHYFLCGPESMIMGVKDELVNKGVSSNAVHFELFTSGAADEAREVRRASAKSDENAKKVTIILDGKEMKFDFTSEDDNVLDKALESGADLPFACKGGVCCTCKAKLEEGETEMYVNYGLEEDEIDRGFILTCQAYPKTDSVVINFDEV